MKPIRHLAFVVNRNKVGAPGLARELAAVARAAGVRLKQTSRFPLPSGYLKGMDACCNRITHRRTGRRSAGPMQVQTL